MESTSIPIATRSTSGITFCSGPPAFEKLSFPNIQSKCKAALFSPDGKYFAYLDSMFLSVLQPDMKKEAVLIDSPKAYHMAFSPKGTYIMTWEPFIINNACPNGVPNLKIYATESGELVGSFVQKRQLYWEPQWSADEKLLMLLIDTRVEIYENLNFEKPSARINCHRIKSFGLSPNVGTYFILCHTPGSPGQPSFGRLFKHPSYEENQSLLNKSFFQADRVDFIWNSKGNNALLLTSTEVDKTGGSYYGKQGLHFAGLNGQTLMVTMSKEGPIHSAQWSPKNQEFCVVYGFMPARATLFNLKCEPVFELGTGARNAIYYNPQGNILLLAGFGNLRGQIETWDMTNRKLIGKCEASDSTLLQWAPDGVHFLTATTAPRLRIGNGYKVWHFSGSLLHETPFGQELYEVMWKNHHKYAFPEPSTTQKVQGIKSSEPQASTQAYVPPSQRNRLRVGFNFHQDEEAHKPGGDLISKAALSNKKKREAKKAKKADEGETNSPTVVSSVQINLTGDPEKDKKLKNLKKKLDAIEKLKEQQAQGKPLEINQIAKINGEGDLLKELEQLQL